MIMKKISLMKLFALIVIFISSSSLYSQEYQVTFSAPSDESIVILPVPNLEIALKSELSLLANNKKIDSDITVLNTWHNNESSKYIRLLSINISNYKNTEPAPHSTIFSLKWTHDNKAYL